MAAKAGRIDASNSPPSDLLERNRGDLGDHEVGDPGRRRGDGCALGSDGRVHDLDRVGPRDRADGG